MNKKSKKGSPSETETADRPYTSLVSQRKLPFRGRPAADSLNEAIDAALEERFDNPVRP